MNDTLIIKLPYPVRFLTIPRKIGFLFTNLALFLLREDKGFDTSTDYEKWVKENGNTALANEWIYNAARAYCLQNRKRENFTKEGLLKAIAIAPAETKEKIMKTWLASEQFGATIKQNKKKVK